MFKNATPEEALIFLRFSVAAAFFIPVSPHASRLKIICYNTLKFLTFVNLILSLYPAINALQTCTDPMDVSESAIYLIGICMVISNIITSIIRSNDILMAMELTENVCKNANDLGRHVLQRYMEQFSTFYGISVIWSYMTGVAFIVKSIITSERYPLNAVYPFRVDYQPWRTIIFLHQSFYVFNATGNASINAFCGFLLFFAAARFEILKLKLSNVKSTDELIIRMEEYYVVKEYANFVVNIVKLVSPCTVIIAVVGLVLCGINLIQPQPFAAKLQYIFLVATATLAVFVCALPADNLLSQSDDAMRGIFESTWYNQSTKMQRDIQIMMMPQPPVTIKVPCIISTLSLNYFCSFLSNAFSTFSVLRAAISEDEDK